MSSRYHWITGSHNTLGAIPIDPVVTLITLPGSAVLKRFMLRNALILTYTRQGIPDLVRPLYQSQVVAFVFGANVGRQIYTSSKRVPFDVAFDPLEVTYPYKGWYSAGDLELGFNQRCSYGNAGDGPAQLTLTTFIQSQPSYDGSYAGEVNYEFACLYYL